jgi:hypothetical protein
MKNRFIKSNPPLILYFYAVRRPLRMAGIKKQHHRYLALLLAGCLGTAAAVCQTLTVNNDLPRMDRNGQIVDAHDGRIIQFGKTFYWYGTRYGGTNGFTAANEYVCYSSQNLAQWKYEGVLLPQKPAGVYYRPHVVHNKRTDKYILWYNWYPQLWNGRFGVAISDRPTGPFKIVNDSVVVKHNALGVGDLGVFTDDDGRAYLSYNTITNHKVSVELLDGNYTASTLQGSDFIAEHCEAGAMFKRNGVYYLLTDYTCCFCTQGSGARIYTATQPLGPYTCRQNINRYAGEPAPLLHDGYSGDNVFETLDPKKEEAVEIAFGNETMVADIQILQFTGNRNGQCGEVDNPRLHQPILRHGFSLQYWNNGVWQPLQTGNPVITQTALQTAYQYKFAPVRTHRVQLTPVYADSVQPLLLSEIKMAAGKSRFRIFKTGRQPGKPIIPAQQTYVMQVQTRQGPQFIWMGDLWGSATDNMKGHDYQFWSAPLRFYTNGLIQPLQWTNAYQLKIN